MRTIGLIGGMSWESTVCYYREINEAVKARLGGLHSARLVLYSVDFEPVERLQRAGDWNAAGRELAQCARSLESAGAEALVLCTNTMHKVAPDIERAVRIPLLHIADATAAPIRAARLATVGLLGTRFTMEQDFYRGRLRERHGLDVLTPDIDEQALVHRVIYEELCLGMVTEASRAACLRVIERLAARGAQGIILGCTELTLLIAPRDVSVPVFDTTALHARHAVDWSLAAG